MEGDKKNKFSGVTKLSWWAFVRFVQMHERKNSAISNKISKSTTWTQEKERTKLRSVLLHSLAKLQMPHIEMARSITNAELKNGHF